MKLKFMNQVKNKSHRQELRRIRAVIACILILCIAIFTYITLGGAHDKSAQALTLNEAISHCETVMKGKYEASGVGGGVCYAPASGKTCTTADMASQFSRNGGIVTKPGDPCLLTSMDTIMAIQNVQQSPPGGNASPVDTVTTPSPQEIALLKKDCQQNGGTFDPATQGCNIPQTTDVTKQSCEADGWEWKDNKCVLTTESCAKKGGTIVDGACKTKDSNNLKPAKPDTFTPIVQEYLNFIFAGIGVLAAAGAVIAGIQYMTAREDPQKVVQAKERLLNVVIAILLFVGMFIFLQWLVPGGVFK